MIAYQGDAGLTTAPSPVRRMGGLGAGVAGHPNTRGGRGAAAARNAPAGLLHGRHQPRRNTGTCQNAEREHGCAYDDPRRPTERFKLPVIVNGHEPNYPPIQPTRNDQVSVDMIIWIWSAAAATNSL
jgi:hypothetical protein